MSLVAREALRVLAAHISTNVAALTGKVRESWSDASHEEGMPVCGLVPRRFKPEWFNDTAIGGVAPTSAIQIGVVTGTVELRVAHQTAAQREVLCDDVLNLFLAAGASVGAVEAAAGSLVLTTAALTVAGISTGVTASVAYDLDSFEWNEERVFEAARFAFLDLTVEFPIVVARSDRYTITDLRLAISDDLTSAEASVVADETVRVLSDGTVAPYP